MIEIKAVNVNLQAFGESVCILYNTAVDVDASLHHSQIICKLVPTDKTLIRQEFYLNMIIRSR